MKSIVIAMLAALFVLTGCNTVKGFGKDLEKVGGKIEGAASK